MDFTSVEMTTSDVMSVFGGNDTTTEAAFDAMGDEMMNNSSFMFGGNSSEVPTCDFNIFNMNFSEYEYEYNYSWRPITWREVLKIVAFVIVFLVSLAGNMLVILVVYYNDHMRTSTNQYLVNLAFADLLVTMGSMWVHMVRHLSYPNYVLPAIVCKFDAFIQTTALLGSVLTLTVISVGRFVAVMFPFLARTSPDRAHRVIAGVWIVSASVASPILIYRERFGVQWKDFTSYHCEEFWPHYSYFDEKEKGCIVKYTSKMVYYTILTAAFYFLPICIMLVNYSMVVWKLWMTQLPGEQSDPARYACTRSKKRVVKMISVVLLVFALCWTPLQTIILYTNFIHSTHNQGSLPEWFPIAEFVAYYVAYSNSALNPIIYCGFNANFRQGLVSLLTCRHSSFSRMNHCRNWRHITARTHETTVGNSGPDHAVVVDLHSIGRNNVSHRGPPQGGRISITSSCAELRQNNISEINADLDSKRCHSEGGTKLETAFGQSTGPSTIYNNHALHHELHHNHNRNHDANQGQNGRRLPLMTSCDSNHSCEGVGCACCRRQLQ